MPGFDRGTETIVVYGSIEDDDGQRVPGTTGVTVERVHFVPQRTGEDASDGQDAHNRWTISGRFPDIPGFDAYAEVEWVTRGNVRLDVVGPPQRPRRPRYQQYLIAVLEER